MSYIKRDMMNSLFPSMKRLQVVQDWALRVIGEYDSYTTIEQLNSNNEIPMLKKCVEVFPLKLYACAKASRSRNIQRLGLNLLVDNRRFLKPSHRDKSIY